MRLHRETERDEISTAVGLGLFVGPFAAVCGALVASEALASRRRSRARRQLGTAPPGEGSAR